MSPLLVTLLVVAFVVLLVLQQVVFEWNLRRARRNRTGLFALRPGPRRVVAVLLAVAAAALLVLQWHTP